MKSYPGTLHAKPRRRPIAERNQTAIAGAATVALIAGLVVVFGYGVPYAPRPDKPKMSLQETHR